MFKYVFGVAVIYMLVGISQQTAITGRCVGGDIGEYVPSAPLDVQIEGQSLVGKAVLGLGYDGNTGEGLVLGAAYIGGARIGGGRIGTCGFGFDTSSNNLDCIGPQCE